MDAGIKHGHVYGETNELDRHSHGEGRYATDLHANVRKLTGLCNRRLEISRRKRLEIDCDRPIHEIRGSKRMRVGRLDPPDDHG